MPSLFMSGGYFLLCRGALAPLWGTRGLFALAFFAFYPSNTYLMKYVQWRSPSLGGAHNRHYHYLYNKRGWVSP